MNYRGKTVGITGMDGFIGSRVFRALKSAGASVFTLDGDVRDPATFQDLDYSFDYLFHFAAPSSQILFKRQAEFSIDTTINGFINAMAACERNGIKLIYPSTGLLSSDRSNEYARCKKICEDLVEGANLDALGIRIFATYGPGEDHKRDYASVVWLFVRDMLDQRKPRIFGDGEQVRDFIYIDDVVSAILVLADQCNDRVIDLGSGESHSFNEIIDIVRGAPGVIPTTPEYVDKPAGYVQETAAVVARLHEFYVPKVSFKDGIERTVAYEQSNRDNYNKLAD